MMKKFIAILLCGLLFAGAFSGCGNGSESKTDSDKLSIVTTIFPQYDFARQVVGDKAEITMLVKPGKSSHDFAANVTVSDISKIEQADVFVYVGGESDRWIDEKKVFDGMNTENKQIINMLELVDKYEEEVIDGMEPEHDEHEDDDDEGIEYDEHIWTNPKNAILITNSICDAVCAVDGENAQYYKDNAAAYIKQLTTLDDEIENAVQSSPHKTILVADRFPFRYLTERYGLTYYAAFAGCSTQQEASISTVNFLVNKVKELKLKYVFYADGSNGALADQVCNETGAEKLLLHSCHDLNVQEFDDGATYLSIMQQNLKNLKEALQ